MKEVMKQAAIFVLKFLPVMIVAGAFVGIYSFDTFDKEVQNQIIDQIGSYKLLIVVASVQTVIFSSVCGFIGYILSVKVNLMRKLKFKKEALTKTLIITLICGILFSLDYWIFGAFIPKVATLYETNTTIASLIGSALYGGIIEEILMRLFLMSLFVYIIWKVIYRNKTKEEIPMSVYIIANIITALLFAAGHLPATINIFGQLTPLLIIRCFVLNGGFGLVFGWLYTKYGIQYAMVSHMGLHIISKLIWTIFI
ncbi:CPBP family intramembrane glutamic endopeptidase [Mycoplasma sp. P36-A1]|uniref:CPBP family intramembrane glutamic endopeptidase n=1 Tax=Mycoplasma sp. P36-A1 TaxID=3252900 RepID=UPI003C2EEA55